MKFALLTAAALIAFGSSAANANVDIYVSQSSAGVYAQTLGSLNISGLAVQRRATNAAAVRGD